MSGPNPTKMKLLDSDPTDPDPKQDESKLKMLASGSDPRNTEPDVGC